MIGARPRLLLLLAATIAATALGCGGSADTTGVPGEVSVDLQERNDANVVGARAVLHYEDKSRTRITVDGLDGGERPGPGANPVRLVRGSCDEPGNVAFELQPLAGPTSETMIRMGMDELYEGDFAVEVLFSSKSPEALACGDVPDAPPA